MAPADGDSDAHNQRWACARPRVSEKQLGCLIETKNVFNFHQAQGSNGKITR